MPDHAGGKSGAVAWVRSMWRAAAAELVSTALLVGLGVAALLPRLAPDNTLVAPPLEHAALAFAFVVLANVEAFGPISGAHMNPAVTLTAVLTCRMPPLTALVYLVAQVLGALLGFGVLAVLVPAAVVAAPAGCTSPGAAVTPLGAVVLEALLTAPLALLCCAVWTRHDAGAEDPTVSIKFGFTVGGLIYAGGYLTGASLNPARSLAPALYHGYYDYQWVYWLGPLCGAAAAALIHRLLTPPAPRPSAAPEDTPLTDTKHEP